MANSFLDVFLCFRIADYIFLCLFLTTIMVSCFSLSCCLRPHHLTVDDDVICFVIGADYDVEELSAISKSVRGRLQSASLVQHGKNAELGIAKLALQR